MRSLPAKQAATAALLLALPLSLAACGSSTSDKGTSQTSKPSATSSSAPAADSKAGTGGGGSSEESGKPSKAQIADGMTNYFVGKGVPRSLVDDVTTCVADKGYSQFSDATLRALKSGKVNELNPLDAGKLAKVTTTCLADPSGGSLPSSVG